MPHDTTRPSLLLRLRDHGDQEAWREFDRQYRDLVLRYCRRRGLQANDAEDVRQWVLLNLSKGMGNFEYRPERGRFRDYLGRTVQNAIHRLFRRPRREVRGLETQDFSSIEASEAVPLDRDLPLDREWEIEWMNHHYRMAMGTLRRSSEARSLEVFEHLLAGGTTDGVARHFGMTRDAVHKVKQRVRDRLKELIAEQIADEDKFDTRIEPGS